MDTRLLSAILAGVAVFFGLLALFPGKGDDEPGLGEAIRAWGARRVGGGRGAARPRAPPGHGHPGARRRHLSRSLHRGGGGRPPSLGALGLRRGYGPLLRGRAAAGAPARAPRPAGGPEPAPPLRRPR